mgnify:CR=1 FL=1
MSMLRADWCVASFRWFSKCEAISDAVFGPTNGFSSSAVAFAIRSIEPNCLSSFIFRFSPTPGISDKLR